MNRESFLDAVKQQYSEEINEAYIECGHAEGSSLDMPELNKRLSKLMANAKVEGLSEPDFLELVRSILGDVADKVTIKTITQSTDSKRKAA